MASRENLLIYREVCRASDNYKLTVIDVKSKNDITTKEGLVGFKTFDECKQVLDDLKKEFSDKEFKIVSFIRNYDDKLWEIEDEEVTNVYDTVEYYSSELDYHLWDEDEFYQHMREKIDEYIEDKDLRLVKLYANKMYEQLGFITDIIETAKKKGIEGEYMYCGDFHQGIFVPYECMQFYDKDFREIKAIGILVAN